MSNLVIVAIPDENDRVWKVSSEKVPHLTLLFLGDVADVSNLEKITEFVEHAANTSLRRFYLPVDRRDELGTDKADTLIFKKGRYDYKAVRDFRMQLLKDNNIKTAYDSATQHEGPWMPHLTLGYPDTPAKPDDTDRDYGFYDVAFNKIAIWTGDYDGPEFLLKDPWDEWETMEAAPLDIAMSDIRGIDPEILMHYGVKGMRWGVRNNTSGAGESKREGLQKFLDPQGHRLSDDAAKLAAGVIFPPFSLLTIPANIRVNRAAYRGAKAKLIDRKEKKDDAKFEKVAKSQEGFVAIHNGASTKVNREIGGINKKYSDADMANPTKRKKYDAEVLKLMQDAYKESANSIGNKRGTKHLDVEFKGDGQDFAIKIKDGPQTPTVEKVKHADIADDDTVTFSGKIKRNKIGYIIGFDFEDFDSEPPVDEMAQSVEDGAEFLVNMGLMTPEDFLEQYGIVHYGVKGMRWGVRRASDVPSGPPSAVAPEASSRVRAGNKRKTKIDVEGGQNHDAAPEALRVAESVTKLKKSGVKTLSNQELQEVAKRLQLESQVKQLVAPAGKKFVTNLLKQQGNQQAQALVSQQVKKQFSK